MWHPIGKVQSGKNYKGISLPLRIAASMTQYLRLGNPGLVDPLQE